MRRLLIILIVPAVLAAPVAAQAKGGRPDVRVTAGCGGGISSSLRLQGRDDGIRVRFEVEHGRVGSWHVTLVHERRVAWKGTGRGSFEIERTLPDFPGSDAVTARATGPGGVVCQATAVVPDVSDGGNGAGRGRDT